MIHEHPQALTAVSCAGPDAVEFMHSQLSCDVRGLRQDQARYGALLNAKGKVLGLTLLVRLHDDELLLLLDPSLGQTMVATLQRFVFRAKVKFTPASDWWVAIDPSPGALDFDLSRLPVKRADGAHITIGWPGALIRLTDQSRAQPEAQPEDQSGDQPGDQGWTHQAWQDHLIDTGIVPFQAAMIDQFVPALLNLDLLGLLSFSKGCYPGQEIVARTRHLGRIKRRLFLVQSDCELERSLRWQHEGREVGRTVVLSSDRRRGLVVAPLALAGATVTAGEGGAKLRTPAYLQADT